MRVVDELIAKRLLDVGGADTEPGEAVDHVLNEVEAVEVVADALAQTRRTTETPPLMRPDLRPTAGEGRMT